MTRHGRPAPLSAAPTAPSLTQYFDEKGQTLSTVISDANPGGSANHWPTQVLRNSTGHVSEVWTPMAISAYTHSTGAFTANTSTAGLVRLFTRETSGSAIGYLTERRFAASTDWGDSDWDNPWLEHVYTWDKTSALQTRSGIGSYIRPLLASSRSYWGDSITSGTTKSDLTSYAYTVHSSQTLAVKKVTETQPAVSTGKSGSGSTHNIYSQLRADGQLEMRSERTIEATGKHIIEWRKYTTDGQLSERISDADTTSLGTSIDDEFESVTGALNDSETYTYDDQGRQVTHTTHDGRVEVQYWSKIGDGRVAHISYPHYVTSPSTKYYGPAGYSILNHAGKLEFEAVLPFTSGGTSATQTSWIDEGDSDPITALGASTSFATPTNIRTTLHDASGMRRTESREYFLTPSSGAGTSTANYDPTTYAYDGMGRLIRTEGPHGTVWRSDFDKRGNVTARHVGTNDTGLDGSTDSGTSNMTQTDATAFDANGRVTSSTVYLTSTVGTPSRVTSYTLDLRGRRILTTNPTAPHALAMYDNLGRQTAVGLFSSTSGLTASSVPYDETNNPFSNRMALSRTLYDERGQVWKTVHHKIDATDGSDDDSLESLTWFDEIGRVVKVDGEQLAKYSYDRLGQRTHEFILATDDDTTFTHVLDVAGDKVFEERQSVYDSGHRVWMTATISRLHGDTSTTGALDTDNGANTFTSASSGTMKGRIQITAYWFDSLSRETDRAEFGTNDATTNGYQFDRGDYSTAPTRSDTVLVTSTTYDDAGRVSLVTDPKGQVTKYEYDDAGRTVTEIANFLNGSPSGETAEDDNIVRYVYADGLMTQLWVDVNGDSTQNGNDQVTTYAFGTAKGTSAGESQIATGHLLQKETYPDSASSTDVVTYAYNAQGEVNWKKDQAGNIIETEFDGSGRLSARKVTTLASGFDNHVLRIGHTYDNLGRTASVSQYSAATGGSTRDTVEYSYDGWGNLSKFNQDALGNSGWRDIEYTHTKATTGRNTLRRTAAFFPNDQEYRYLYSSSSSLDDAASRVTNVANSSNTPLATYTYLGSGHVVKTYLEEPDAYSTVINSNGTAYEGLDRFNRPIKSRWTKDLSTDVDFFSVNVGWDRASNVQYQDDQVQVGHDALYANDARNRLTDADEGTITIGTPSTIGSGTRTRRQTWVLTQTGNWSTNKVDLDGDGAWSGTGELNETRVHNKVNELESRDTNSSSPAEFNLVYDAVGNMTSDNENYRYKWDAFGRLREVTDLSNNVVSEYWYNGLGYLTTRLQDTTLDGVADPAVDRKYVTIYDERWRQVATYRVNPSTGALDANPKEQFLYHAAGNGGWGGSSYIDSVILRDRDTNLWTNVGKPSSGTSLLQERLYYCQNWRADVVVMLDFAITGTTLVQNVRYSAYGVPFGIPYGDVDSDGDCDGGDDAQVSSWISSSTYNVRGDLDLDGDVDSGDLSEVQANEGELGYGALSDRSLRNRKGYAGYEGDSSLSAVWHVRHRVLESRLGRWLRRDPTGYVGESNLYPYCAAGALRAVDFSGLDLYAVDGTHADFSENSNVVKFYKEYNGPKHYYAGPDDGLLGLDSGHLAGKVKSQICDDYCKAKKDGRKFDVDLVGWSRGAAISTEVAWRLAEEGCCCEGSSEPCPMSVDVRFLGLFDSVDMTGALPNEHTEVAPPKAKVAHAKKTTLWEQHFPSQPIPGEYFPTPIGGSAEVPSTHGDIGRRSRKALDYVRSVAAEAGAPILGGDPAGGVVHQPPGGDDSIFLNPCYIQLRYGPGAVSW
jgi:RHS repeat-associated protein